MKTPILILLLLFAGLLIFIKGETKSIVVVEQVYIEPFSDEYLPRSK